MLGINSAVADLGMLRVLLVCFGVVRVHPSQDGRQSRTKGGQ